MTQIVYHPPMSVQGFLSSENFVSLIVGPVGSTKTSAGIMKIAYHAKQMAKGRDGVRRSRCVWIRNTRQMLLDWEKRYPGRIDNLFNAMGKLTPSHLMDRSLYPFETLKATGQPDPAGDRAFDPEDADAGQPVQIVQVPAAR